MQEKRWDIVVDSIGNSGAGLIAALRQVSPLSENRLASMLYQAPSVLLTGLPLETAQSINELLCSTGLESHINDEEDEIENGDASHEIAMVINDFSRVTQVVELIMKVLGTDMETARKMLCSSPTMLMGSVSVNTVEALRPRFAELDIELDISQPGQAVYDAFCGETTAMEQRNLERMLGEVGIPDETMQNNSGLVATGLSKEKSDALWAKITRSSLKVRLVNRDFQRYDLRLLEAPAEPEMYAYLTQSTGMPEKVARKIPAKAPIVLHRNISFAEMTHHLEQITDLGAIASGHLLVFQTFSLKIEKTVKAIKQNTHLKLKIAN